MALLQWVFLAAIICSALSDMNLSVVSLGMADYKEPSVCHGSWQDEDDLALSLRQLRVSSIERPAHDVALAGKPADEATQEPLTDEDDEDNGAMPGGWGEAAMAAESMMAMKNWQPQRRSRWPRTVWHQRNRQPASPPSVRTLLTLYHQTSPEAGQLILSNGFRPGSQGWCGGAIYFATSPEATETKAIGPDSRKGFMIQAMVDVGRIRDLSSVCDRSLTRTEIHSQRYDSVHFNPGDGDEYAVYDADRVLSTLHYQNYQTR